MPSDTTSAAGASQRSGLLLVEAPSSAGASSSRPDTPDTIMSTCCARCEPNQYTRTRLAMTDPKIAPTVFAA